MQKKAQNRPHFNTPGAELIALIEGGNKSALREGRLYRTSKLVKAAVAAADAPATSRKPRTRSAKSIRAELAKAPAKTTRKTGVGSRGGDPRKAEAFQVALATGAKVWSPDFKAAYKAHLGSLVGAAA